MTRPLRAFISYRRSDTFVLAASATATTFIERLTAALRQLGFSEVFVDTEEPMTGEEFEGRIHRAISNCDLFIPLIGPDWLRLLHEKRRDPEPDILVRELQAALRLDKDIVPLLIDGAVIPRFGDLPETIGELAAIDAETVASDAPVEAIAAKLGHPARAVARIRRLGPRWIKGYALFGLFVWLLCGVVPHVLGWWEFGDAWVGLATGWAGFFIYPFFFMPFVMFALYRPFQVVLEATLNADNPSDALKFASPIILGAVFALAMTVVEVSPLHVPWSIHPKLADQCSGPEDRALKAEPGEPVVAYDRDRRILAYYGTSDAMRQKYGNEFWMNDKCWPNVFFYLTVPPREEWYAAERNAVQHAFLKMLGKDSKGLKGTEAPYSRLFWVYVLSFFVWITLFASALFMAAIYSVVSIRRPRDGRVLRVPNEDAFLCLMYAFITALVWVPFRMVTNSIKFSYNCGEAGCVPLWEFFVKDGGLGLAFVALYVALTVGMLRNHRRLLLGFLGTTVVCLFCALALVVYLFHEKLAEFANYWQFWLVVSLLIGLVLIVLWYQYDPAIVRFKDFQETRRRRLDRDRG